MRRIAGAGMGLLLATVAILYAVWPDLSAAKGKGDDAPIRVRNGSVRILSFDEDGSRPWKWVKKGSCKYQDGSQAACLSREPSKGESEIGSDTEHDASLYVRVNPGGYGACSTQGSTTASGELVEIWFRESNVKPEPAAVLLHLPAQHQRLHSLPGADLQPEPVPDSAERCHLRYPWIARRLYRGRQGRRLPLQFPAVRRQSGNRDLREVAEGPVQLVPGPRSDGRGGQMSEYPP